MNAAAVVLPALPASGFRVFNHIQRGWQQANAVFQFDQAHFLQQQQGTAEVSRVVWNRYLRTVLQFIQ